MNVLSTVPLTAAFLLFLTIAGEGDSRFALGLPEGPVTTPPHKSWQACSKDSVCTATWLSCSGWIAINRRHVSDMQHGYSRKNTDLLNLVECRGPTQPAPRAVCRVHVCELE